MTHPFTVPVTVITPTGGASAPTPAAQFTYLPPTVTAISPDSGPLAGGTSVSITGSGFTGATAVNFGPNQVQPTSVNSDTSITATSPAATSLGSVGVTVTVTSPTGTSATSNAGQFTYPMGVLFHQNMRTFGTATGQRNNAYLTAFQAISAHLNPVLPSVLIAGFTELTNNSNAVAGLNNGLCTALGVEPAQAVCTRQTALRTQPGDFTGIAVAAGVNILSWGRVVFSVTGQGVTLSRDVWDQTTATFADWAANVPGNQTLDYQSLVYVVADIGDGIVVAVAFLHNVFSINDNVTLALQSLPPAAKLIAQDPAAQNAGNLYICGDFNAAPRQRGTGRTGPIAVPFSQQSLLPLPPGTAPPLWSPNAILTPTQVGLGFRPGGTTAAGNLYDYSFLSVIGNPPPQLMQPQPAIDVVTLDTPGGNNFMSDHAASLLNI